MIGLIEGLVGLIAGLVKGNFGLVTGLVGGIFGLEFGVLGAIFSFLILIGIILVLPVLLLVAIF